MIDVCKIYYPKATQREDGKIRLTKGSGYHSIDVAMSQVLRKCIDVEL